MLAATLRGMSPWILDGVKEELEIVEMMKATNRVKSKDEMDKGKKIIKLIWAEPVPKGAKVRMRLCV